MAESKTYEPIEGSEDLILETQLRISQGDEREPGESFVVDSWPYTTEHAGEQVFLDAHELVQESAASGAESEAEAAPKQAASSGDSSAKRESGK